MLEGKSHDDLPIEDRETNARMAIQSLDFFRFLWPSAKVWYLHMSMMNENDLGVKRAREFSGERPKLLGSRSARA